ncbi:MAG: Sec-independent protein translocase protein TatB [Candidatus Symbiobacter sp.]|nr:Sec-independent protein translocase protein TatB [Candidatus Symbiobacter sp.]
MFDFAWSELMVIAIVAMVVIGPRDLPKLLYGLGQWVRKARSIVSEFQAQMEEIGRQDEIDALRKELEDTNRKIEADGRIDEASLLSDTNIHAGSEAIQHENSILPQDKTVKNISEPVIDANKNNEKRD